MRSMQSVGTNKKGIKSSRRSNAERPLRVRLRDFDGARRNAPDAPEAAIRPTWLDRSTPLHCETDNSPGAESALLQAVAFDEMLGANPLS
jgi:hypothetical protein